MSKALSNILTIFKVARIVAKVVFILCIVGAVGCVVGLITLPVLGGILPADLLAEEGIHGVSAYLACAVGLITCVGEIIFAFLAERYFANVLNAGTPFTYEGAKESFRLGLASIIISVATSVAAGIALGISLMFSPDLAEFDAGTSFSLSTGLFFLFLSLIFKHGAEVQTAAADAFSPEEPKEDVEV